MNSNRVANINTVFNEDAIAEIKVERSGQSGGWDVFVTEASFDDGGLEFLEHFLHFGSLEALGQWLIKTGRSL